MDDVTSKTMQSTGGNATSGAGNNRLNLRQQDFLELMLTQIKHQDPLNPMESGDFFSQLAQISTVNGINGLQSSFEDLSANLKSNQALQASTLVGSSVLVPSKTVTLDIEGDKIEGAIDLTDSSDSVELIISDSTGKLVRQINLDSHPKGLVYFTWDGLDNNGNKVIAGDYQITARARLDNEAVAQDTLFFAKVDSVTLNQDEKNIVLNLAGQNGVDFSDVRVIK